MGNVITREVLLEMAKDKELKSRIELFYEHSLKWIYKESFQTTSWIKTIINNSKEISKIIKLKSEKNKITKELLYKLYKIGEKKAKEKINFDDNDRVFNNFNTVDKIADENYVRKWLKYNAHSESIKDKIDNKKLI